MSLSPDFLRAKSAFITGSGRPAGIGAAIAQRLAQHGANVAINYVSESSKESAHKIGESLAQEYGVKTTVVRGGMESRAAADAMIEEVLQGLGVEHVDILVNNAGIGSGSPLSVFDEKVLLKEFQVNTFGPLFLTQAVIGIGKMPRGGRIVNIGSIASKDGEVNLPVYSASKAALDSLTYTWAGELGRSHGITVNTVAPGPVMTDVARPHLENADGSPTALQLKQLSRTRAANRIGGTDDIASAVLLLVTEHSRWITGQWISVSGGYNY